MSKILKLGVLLLALLTITASTSFAQKFGHLNSGNLLASMPEVAAADKQMETFQKQKQSQFENKIKDFQTRFAAVNQLAAEGKLTPIEQQTKTAEFQKEQESLAKLEQTIQMEIANKRQELLAPILKKVDEAIKVVGKEKGYQFIFDTSGGAFLYAVETEDVMSLVKGKLGM